MREYWELFDLAEGSSQEDLRLAYRKLVRQWHPDRFVGNARRCKVAEERMKRINEAYRVLASTYASGAESFGARPNPRARTHRNAAGPKANTLGGVRWLQSEFSLTYLPLAFATLIAVTPKVKQLWPLTYLTGCFALMAWFMLAFTVWHNERLSRRARISWIAGMIVFAAITVPIYFARHVRGSTA